MIFDFEPGDKVLNPAQKDWGIGQVQSIIKGKVTVNFQNAGKKVINSENVELKNGINSPSKYCLQINTCDWIFKNGKNKANKC